MKKKLTKFISCVLVLALLLPMAAFANGENQYEYEYEEQEATFVPLRLTAYELGAQVYWNEATRNIHLTLANGAYLILPLDEVGTIGGFVEDGVTWIPLEVALLLFAFQPDGLRIIALTEEAREYALEDFDYLMALILANSPWESVIYRRLGIELSEVIAVHRYVIYNMLPLQIIADLPEGIDWSREHTTPRDLAADYLFALLFGFFSAEIESIGHMSPVLPFLHRDMLVGNLRGYIAAGGEMDWDSDFGGNLFLQTFADERVLWFYGDDEIDFGVEGQGTDDPYNIEVAILVPDEVAFLRINSFLNNMELDDLIIYPFLQEVRDFNHLIIDLRGNGGGYVHHFNSLIASRLITEPLHTTGHEFFGSGELALEWVDFFLAAGGVLASVGAVTDMRELYAADFIAERGFPYINADDLAMLDYAIVWYATIHPADEPIGFDGKIWLLVDGGSASASAVITQAALTTGFATVVGENTSGVMGSMTSFVILPNTGIIFRIDIGYLTDAYGRSLEEYGIAPNIRNRAGLNALETVLELIAEGAY